MVVKAENGRTITMTRAPKLALVQPSLPAAALRGESVPANATLGRAGLVLHRFPLASIFRETYLNFLVSSTFGRCKPEICRTFVAEINAPGMKALKVPFQRSSQGNIVDVGMPTIFDVQVCLTCFMFVSNLVL